MNQSEIIANNQDEKDKNIKDLEQQVIELQKKLTEKDKTIHSESTTQSKS